MRQSSQGHARACKKHHYFVVNRVCYGFGCFPCYLFLFFPLPNKEAIMELSEKRGDRMYLCPLTLHNRIGKEHVCFHHPASYLDSRVKAEVKS